MNSLNEIPVFFSVDDEYAPFIAAAINSAVKNSSKEHNYKAIIIHKELSEENKAKINRLASDNFKIEFVPMEEELGTITDRISNRFRDYFTLTIYFRLFIPEMFPQYDKGIYIDSDVILNGDLSELYGIDIGDNYIGACEDRSVNDIPEIAYYFENAVGVEKHKYVNSGVLLMNLKKLREVQLGKHFMQLLNTYHFDSVAPDQDYINAMCSGKIFYLDAEWDAMPNPRKPELSTVKLIHYNLFSKPWCYDNVQYGEYFWEYIKGTGYEKQAYDRKNNYSEENIKSDDECFKSIISRCLSIPKQDITFKKAAESGVNIRL